MGAPGAGPLPLVAAGDRVRTWRGLQLREVATSPVRMPHTRQGAAVSRDNLIWIDLEMTGLDPDSDFIIEMAAVVTDAQLQILAEGPVIAVHQSDEQLARMDEWNTRQHGASGLTERVRASQVDASAAEQLML